MKKTMKTAFNAANVGAKTKPFTIRNYQILAKRHNGYGGMAKIEADDIGEAKSKFLKKEIQYGDIDNYKKQTKSPAEVANEQKKMISLFKEMCKKAIERGENQFLTFICFSNKGHISRVDLSEGTIPKVYVKVTGGIHLS